MTKLTMLELVAGAIGEVAFGFVSPVETPNTWAQSMEMARAALQALREPTEGVVSALDMEILTEGVSGEDCRRAFVAAIDAILQEKA